MVAKCKACDAKLIHLDDGGGANYARMCKDCRAWICDACATHLSDNRVRCWWCACNAGCDMCGVLAKGRKLNDPAPSFSSEAEPKASPGYPAMTPQQQRAARIMNALFVDVQPDDDSGPDIDHGS